MELSSIAIRNLLDVILLLAILDSCWGQYGTWDRDRDMMRRHGDVDEYEPDPNYFYLQAIMPRVVPAKADQYLCSSFRVTTEDAYIISFEPHANMDLVHHMLLYGCHDVQTMPGRYYDCGNMGTCRGHSNILFAWARNASQPSIPRGVGFHVGGNSGIRYLTLQVHYGDISKLEGPDQSGLSVDMTLIPQPLAGGVYLLGANQLNIPPGSTNYHADIACKYNDPVRIYPFAFRTHAHELGTVISGYRIRHNQWTTLGKADPRWPQAFYQMDHVYEIRAGDILAARCTYNAEGRYSVTHSGSTSHDEMCNFYMMYYTDPINGESFKMCWDEGNPEIFKFIPPGSDISPKNPPTANIPVDNRIQDDFDADLYPGYDDDNGGKYLNNWYGNQDDEEGNLNDDYNYDNLLNKFARITEPSNRGQHREDDEMPQDDDTEMNDEDKEEDEEDVVTAASPARGKIPLEDAQMTTVETMTEGSLEDEAQHGSFDNLVVVDDWPVLDGLVLGQVAGVAVDSRGDVHVFHRVDRIWENNVFSHDDHFLRVPDGRIKNNTVLVFDKDSGRLKHQWGANLFFLPHGLSIDHEGNIWLTDVALHQTFKFPAAGGDVPTLTLGTELEPGTGTSHFCKPTDVAVDPETGEVFVADGYCNSRIVKFSASGDFIMDWGKASSYIGRELAISPAPGTFFIPHSLTFITGNRELYVADRENGRIQCFNSKTGSYKRDYKIPEFGSSVYAVDYSPWKGGILYAINGPDSSKHSDKPAVQGFTLDVANGRLLHTWKPDNSEFGRPHDVAASSDFKNVYVVEIGPNKIWKFQRNLVQAAFNQSELTGSDILPPDLARKTPNRHIPNAITDASLATTSIIVAVLAVPIFLMLLIAVIIRLRAQGRMRFFHDPNSGTAIRQGYLATKDQKFSLGNFFNRRNGFNQVSTEDSDHDGGMGWSDESDVEEYSILNSKRTQNL